VADQAEEAAPRTLDAGAGPRDPVGQLLFRVSRGLAIAGGLVTIVAMAITLASTIGGAALNAPILGDKEIIEFGCAFALFAFMPYCQMRGSNIIVDVFTKNAPEFLKTVLDAVGQVMFVIVVAMITWRLSVGAVEAFRDADATTFLRLPVWFGYATATGASFIWVLVCAYTGVRSVKKLAGVRD